MEPFGAAHRADRSALDRTRRTQCPRPRRAAAWIDFCQGVHQPLAARGADLRAGRVSQRGRDLVEWDYGQYESRRTAEIHAERSDWDLFRDGCPGGETPDQVGARADRVVGRLRAIKGDVLVFSHGHFLRVLAARWLGLRAAAGQHFLLDTASLSALGYEHKLTRPAIRLWNETGHVET